MLTPADHAIALRSRERHRIVEAFLLALGVAPETARRDAEGLEHHVSRETLDAFARFLKAKQLAGRLAPHRSTIHLDGEEMVR